MFVIIRQSLGSKIIHNTELKLNPSCHNGSICMSVCKKISSSIQEKVKS